MTHDEILADFPDLEREDLQAAMVWATRLARMRRLEAIRAYQSMKWLIDAQLPKKLTALLIHLG